MNPYRNDKPFVIKTPAHLLEVAATQPILFRIQRCENGKDTSDYIEVREYHGMPLLSIHGFRSSSAKAALKLLGRLEESVDDFFVCEAPEGYPWDSDEGFRERHHRLDEALLEQQTPLFMLSPDATEGEE